MMEIFKIDVRVPAFLEIIRLLFITALAALCFCSATATPQTEAKAQSKKAKHAVVAPTYADVAYDIHERTVLDFWQAEGDGPRPVKVYIHGGGWSQVDKKKQKGIEKFLEAEISVTAINYRLLNDGITLPTPVHDAARAIQFLRFKAKE
jgi:acetyl esterase/lipase